MDNLTSQFEAIKEDIAISYEKFNDFMNQLKRLTLMNDTQSRSDGRSVNTTLVNSTQVISSKPSENKIPRLSKYRVLGIQERKYIRSEDHMKSSLIKVERTKHIIYIKEVVDKYSLDPCMLALTLEECAHPCGSGWTMATSASIFVEETKEAPYTHIPRCGKHLIIELPIDFMYGYWYIEGDEFNNEVFTFSQDGGDSYYPQGAYNIHMDCFEETARSKDRRQVWVISGKSGLGKSFLTSRMKDLTVYETDSSEMLPQILDQDIIVIGNKYTYNMEDIKSRIYGYADVIAICFDSIGCVSNTNDIGSQMNDREDYI